MEYKVDMNIIKDRQKQYGDSFPIYAKLLREYFYQNRKSFSGYDVNGYQSAFMLALLKLSRFVFDQTKEDTIIDMLNYLLLAANFDESLFKEYKLDLIFIANESGINHEIILSLCDVLGIDYNEEYNCQGIQHK